jgi:hypothetical protein
MSPSETSRRDGWLEHPAEAFAYYRAHGVAKVVCEEKHMGSRAVVVLCRDQHAARARFTPEAGDLLARDHGWHMGSSAPAWRTDPEVLLAARRERDARRPAHRVDSPAVPRPGVGFASGGVHGRLHEPPRILERGHGHPDQHEPAR